MRAVRRLLLGLACAVMGFASAATPELSGLFVQDGKPLFVLLDPATKESSRWLGLGDEFAGYTLSDFKLETETLTLKRGSETVTLQPRASQLQLKESPIAFQGEISLGANDTRKVQKLTLNYDEDTTFPVAPNVNLILKASRRKDGTIAYAARFERTEGDGTSAKVTRLSAPGIIARPDQGISVRVGPDLGFELKP